MTPTRKSIGDPKGARSMYVIERQVDGEWRPYISRHGLVFICATLAEAKVDLRVIAMDDPDHKYRIRLYSRVE